MGIADKRIVLGVPYNAGAGKVISSLLEVFQYASNNQKIISVIGSHDSSNTSLVVGKYNKSTPITSIKIKFEDSSLFKPGLKILLYGVR